LNQEMEISQKLLGSEVKLEILAMFHRNPELVERIDGVGRRLGRDTGEIEAEVKDLVDIGVLRADVVEHSKVIYYDRKNDAQIQKQISFNLRDGSSLKERG